MWGVKSSEDSRMDGRRLEKKKGWGSERKERGVREEKRSE